MKITVYLVKTSPTSKKKFTVFIYKNGKKIKTVNFGAKGYSDYTKHKDKDRMKRYESRHKTRENWTKSGIKTAGFWSKWILWSSPSLSGAIRKTSNKFNITIKRSKPPSTTKLNRKKVSRRRRSIKKVSRRRRSIKKVSRRRI